MLAKNVSTINVDLSALDKKYARFEPGDTIDLSQYSEQDKMQCTSLQEAFEVGDVVLITTSCSQLARKKRLEATQKQLDELGMGAASILVSARQPQFREIKSLDKRIQQSAIPPRTPAVAEEEVFAEELPERREIIQLSPEGVKVTESQRVLPSAEKKSLDAAQIKELAQRFASEKCRGINESGRACKRRAVNGYEYCLAHMPSEMREEYKKARLHKLKAAG